MLTFEHSLSALTIRDTIMMHEPSVLQVCRKIWMHSQFHSKGIGWPSSFQIATASNCHDHGSQDLQSLDPRGTAQSPGLWSKVHRCQRWVNPHLCQYWCAIWVGWWNKALHQRHRGRFGKPSFLPLPQRMCTSSDYPPCSATRYLMMHPAGSLH